MHASDRLFLAKYKMNEDKNIRHMTTVYGSFEKNISVTTSESEEVGDKKKWLGFIFCVLSGLCILGANTVVKLASVGVNISSWEMLLIRLILRCI